MNAKRLLSVVAAFFALFSVTMAQQPYGGCWHPDYIIDWTPEKDPDAKFNRSTVPLQERFVDTSVKANANQHPQGQVAACLTMNPMCSQTPSQGADNFIGYNPTYWQYMDLLIWWGGSAGEGIIIPPSAPVTDIAHLHGVKVLGQLFFPPSAFGGQQKWVRQMLTKEGDTYPYAEKMYEIAKYYGFDGWFINEETGGGTPPQWAEWVACYNKRAQADGNTHMEIQWYDASITIGSYTELMKQHNASYFLNYGSPSAGNIASQMTAIQGLGFTEEEAFRKLYFGIEVAQGGMSGNASYFKNLFPTDGHKGSIDLFNPEEPIWKSVVANHLGGPNATGSVAYDAMNTVFKNEARYWTNEQNDPSNTTARDGSYFPGLANAILERSAIQSLPFVTSFSAGLGKHRFVNGENKGTQDWYHRGMQDVLPTWRWWVDVPAANKADLSFSLNWDEAYNAGTSINVKGNLAAGIDYLTRLYKTRVAIKSGDTFELVFKGIDAANMQLKLGVAENGNAFETFNFGSTKTSNGWTVATVDLSSLAGKTVSVVALNFKAAAAMAIDAKLGQLALFPAGYSPAASMVSNLQKNGNDLTQDGGDIRVTWDAPASEEIHHYNVYMSRSGNKQLVGQTRNEGFYISKFQRSSPDETSVNVSVSAVTKDMKEGSEVTITVSYPEIEKPVVSIKTLKSLAKIGEEITLVASATNFPESYNWTIPQGAEQVSVKEDTLVVKFTKEGLYDISVAVTNRIGTTMQTVEKLVEVSDSKADALEIVSVGKRIHSCSGSLPPEDPENLIDGVEVPGSVRDKWCIGGSKEHWVVIDLMNRYQVYRFRIFDCGHKENYSDNFKNFKIWISNDAENWTLVVDEKGRPENTKDDYIAPQIARYVKFMPYDDDAPITIRIWEFQVYGIAGGPIFTAPESMTMSIDATDAKSITYDLNGDEEEANFSFTVTSSDPELVEIADVKLDKTAKKLDFSIKTKKKMGAATISLLITNGEWVTEKTFDVYVDDPSYTNILAGKTVNASYHYYGGNWMESDETVLTDGDKETSWSFTSYASDENCVMIVDCEEFYDFGKFMINTQSSAMAPGRIKIYVGEENNSRSYKQVASFVPESSETTIYTAPATGRFVKFTTEAAMYSRSAVNELEAYGAKSSYEPPVTEFVAMPIVGGFNADVIAENKPSADHTTVALDDQGWVFFTSAVQEAGAMATDKSLTSSTGIPYELGAFDADNALLLKSVKSGEFTFEGAHKAKTLFLLTTSANGTSTINVTVNYEDGTSEAPVALSLGDWFGGAAAGTAMTGVGRMIRHAVESYKADDIDSRLNFRLFESAIPTDHNKLIKSLNIETSSAAYPVVFAVTRESIVGFDNVEGNELSQTQVYPNPVNGGETLIVEAAHATAIRLVSLQGTVLLQEQPTSNITRIAVDGIVPGTYLLVVESERGRETSKVIIR